jgi:hypothetical protein
MPKNAKDHLLELLKRLGCNETCAIFKSESTSPPGVHRSAVTVIFPDGREICGNGEGQRRSDANAAAAQVALDLLCSSHPDLLVDWDKIRSEAQAGDALIKLGAYLASGFNTTSVRSQLLQGIESDSHLAKVFDLWRSQNDPDLAKWGSNLGKKRKATLIEALLWRRFGERVLTNNAAAQLQSMLKTLVVDKD